MDLIHDRGRGPEIVGTRITVYDLLPHFLDETATEAYICRLYDLTAEQVAAARAYILRNVDSILGEHLATEARKAAGNPPEVIEQAERSKAKFLSFKEWLARRDQAEAQNVASVPPASTAAPAILPSFRDWLAEQESRSK